MSSAVRYQVMPPLAPDEYQELHDDIKINGVLEPIHVDEDGVVIDGHHRSRIAKELGIPCPIITHDDLDDAGKRSLAFTLNLKRRHLNREQRRALIAESLKSDPQLSNREHARRTGANHETVGSVRSGMEESGEIRHFEKRVDPRTGNASQSASQPKRETTPEPETTAHGFNPGDLDEINAETETKPKFQPPQNPPPRPTINPPRPPSQIDKELETRAREKSLASGTSYTPQHENPASRNVKRFDAISLARTISKDLNELAGILSDVGGINGMDVHLEDIRSALDVATSANNGGGLDEDLNNLLNGKE